MSKKSVAVALLVCSVFFAAPTYAADVELPGREPRIRDRSFLRVIARAIEKIASLSHQVTIPKP